MPNRIILTNIIADVKVVFVTDLKISINIGHTLDYIFQVLKADFMAELGQLNPE